MTKRTSTVLIVLLGLAAPLAAFAQWSTDPLLNTAIAAKTDEQAQPKVLTLPDGSAYVSWFDNDPTGSPAYGYDMFLQLMDSKGLPVWGADGIRIADRGLSWTTDYGFAVDADGNAILAFGDDRFGVEQITVTKVSPAGVQLWGPTGVQVTSGSTNPLAPQVAVLSDGGIAVGWTSTTPRKGDAANVAKLDASGRVVWSSAMVSDRNYTYQFSSLAAADNGSVVMLAIRNYTIPFSGTVRGLGAQKYSGKGRPQWRKGVVVLDTNSLQGGEFPKVVHDGAGGLVTVFYTATSPLESWIQHLNADGVELFPHNGLAAGTDFADRTEPSFAFDSATGDTILAYNEQGADGYGVAAQRISPSGVRLWGDGGLVVRAFDYSVTTMWPTVVNTSNGAFVFWLEQTAYPDVQVFGSKLDAAGAFLCQDIKVSLAAGSKNRLDACATAPGGAILAWQDARTDFSDIYGDRVGTTCGLGEAP